jgi:hypothetical protein
MVRRKKRVVVQDPERAKMWREAWDLLLTGNYGLEAICEELHNRGYTRKSGKPWVWVDEKTGVKRNANSHLSRTFHMPFYAGWVISKKHGIKRGDVRGHWEPLVTDEEFDRGIAILRKRDEDKVRLKRHAYLLSGMLYMRVETGTSYRDFKMHGATPTGRSRSYTYYTTHHKVDGRRLNIPTAIVDDQVPLLLHNIRVPPGIVPELREVYHAEIDSIKGPGVEEQIGKLRERVKRLRNEETSLGRLYAQGRLTDEAYDRLYQEWQVKVYETEQRIRELANGHHQTINDLDMALTLLECAFRLFERLDTRQRWKLLQIIVKHIIIDPQGKILEVALNTPFFYLGTLSGVPHPVKPDSVEQPELAPNGTGSSQILSRSSEKKPFEPASLATEQLRC